MSKRKIIVTIIIIVAIGLLVAGGILIYQNYANKNRIVTSFNDLKTALKETFNLNSENEQKVSKQTITGTTTFNINPLLGNSTDGSDVIIGNLNNSTFNYLYLLDVNKKALYFNGDLLLNTNEILGLNFYQTENISYIFLRNVFDKYITIEENDIFSYLEDNIKASDDINYIYEKIIESLGSNITNDDIKVTTENNNKKISLELTGNRLNEIATAIIDDLKNDERSKEILGDSINELDTSNNTTDTTNSSITYSIYLNKGEIVTYELGLTNDSNNYSITFNTKDKTSISISENGTETIKGIITKENNTTTINLTSNNTNIGTIVLNKNNINVNFIIDATTNTAFHANIATITNNNKITTEFTMSLIGNNTNMDILSIKDEKTVVNDVAEFNDIDTSNSVNINDLTDEDIANIENNLMTIIYNMMGVSI